MASNGANAELLELTDLAMEPFRVLHARYGGAHTYGFKLQSAHLIATIIANVVWDEGRGKLSDAQHLLSVIQRLVDEAARGLGTVHEVPPRGGL